MRRVSSLEIEEIKHLYLDERVAISTLKSKFRLLFLDIKQILIDNNVKVRTHRESRKTYTYNEEYFSKIDTPDKAYWLGFIYADGFITKKTHGNPVFGITLAEKEPLEKLNRCLNSNKPIGEYKKLNGYSEKTTDYKLAFCSSKMVKDLEKWGCTENKTFKLKFPTFLDDDLIHHFIRGYFDGDGSVFLHTLRVKDKIYSMLGVQFSGIKQFLEDLAKYINAETCIYKDARKETDCYKIQLQSNMRSLSFYHYIYNSSNGLYLSRKKQKFDDFITDRGSTTTISSPTYNAEYKKLCYIED